MFAIAEAFVPGKLNNGEATDYGFGWSLHENDDGKMSDVRHTGSWVGFRTLINRNLAHTTTAIVLTNNSSSDFDDLLDDLSDISDGNVWAIPPKKINHALAEIIQTDGIDAAVARFADIKQAHGSD